MLSVILSISLGVQTLSNISIYIDRLVLVSLSGLTNIFSPFELLLQSICQT